jgi:hypothetical protein
MDDVIFAVDLLAKTGLRITLCRADAEGNTRLRIICLRVKYAIACDGTIVLMRSKESFKSVSTRGTR